MISIRKALVGAAALAVVGLGFVATPPAEAIGETCVVVAAPATINGGAGNQGLYYPATDPNIASNALSGGPSFTWSLNGTCANDGQLFTSQGTANGWCGRSVGHGTGSVGGRSYTIYWESVGSELFLLDPTAFGSVNAQPNPPGSPNGSCMTGTATTFLVSGTISNLR